MRRFRTLLVMLTAACSLGLTTGAPGAQAVPAGTHQPLIALNANQSSNWSGYNQGTIEKGNKLFNQVSADWAVPTARQHKSREAEYSSAWIGIGGGCIDANCLAGDNTLIQTGTEQDVSANGAASYSAWYEIIPGPSLTISNFPVSAGDKMHADIHETIANSNVWVITLKNVTKNKTFTTTLPYSSSHATAEWIVETPLLFGTDGAGFSAMPNLSTVKFDNTATNNANAALKASEEMQLVDSNNKVIALPSAPFTDGDDFNLCTFATTCAAPTST